MVNGDGTFQMGNENNKIAEKKMYSILLRGRSDLAMAHGPWYINIQHQNNNSEIRISVPWNW